ncbi:MAG: hypothetical protein RLZZ40_463 [Actinomycetota bacterium]
MTFGMSVNRAEFDRHTTELVGSFRSEAVSVTPVIKGNGYGFGREVLALESARLKVNRIAVATVFEAEQALDNFAGSVLVLEPIRESDPVAMSVWDSLLQGHVARLVATIDEPVPASVAKAKGLKVLIKVRTSHGRFGVPQQNVSEFRAALPTTLTVIGYSLHLPLVGLGNGVAEAKAFVSSLPTSKGTLEISVSHLSPAECAAVAAAAQSPVTIDARIGASLWLGNMDALSTFGTVTAIRDLAAGEPIGYRSIAGDIAARVLVISGGTSHGVGLAAPTHLSGIANKIKSLGASIMAVLFGTDSPFRIAGRPLHFVEPPHMHYSLVYCADTSVVVGDRIPCTVRKTTSTFDIVEFV